MGMLSVGASRDRDRGETSGVAGPCLPSGPDPSVTFSDSRFSGSFRIFHRTANLSATLIFGLQNAFPTNFS